MDWINIKDQLPKQYEEVIIASNEGRVRAAIYMGNGKWNTFLPVAYWMPYPSAPTESVQTAEAPAVEAPKKKRGRPKKS